MKKHFLLLLVLSVLTIPTKLSAYTNNQIVNFDGNTYKVISVSDFTLCFVGTNKSGHLVIPAEVSDNVDTKFKVVQIGDDGQYRCNNVTSVELPETIEQLNSGSFQGASLTSMNIPKSVKIISHSTGYLWVTSPKFNVDPDNPIFCNDEDGALYSKDMTELYAVPSSVSLDNGTYTVNEKVIKIYYDAFLGNSNLKKIILPKNLDFVELGYPTINNACTELEAFEIQGGGTTRFKTIAGVLFDGNKLINYPQGKRDTSYKIPDGITEIVAYGIMGNYYMKSIDLNEITNLNKSSIILENYLETVTLPKNLKVDNIDGSITSCIRIKEYIVPENCINFKGKDGVVFSNDMTKLYFYPPSKSGSSYEIPSSVTTIGASAFRSAQNITSLEIPKGVSSIGDQAFREMEKLETVAFEEEATITTFGRGIFMSCKLLNEVTLPTSLTMISNAFFYCGNLERINVPDKSQLNNIDGSSFVTNTNLKEFNFLGSCMLKTIGSNAFANLSELTYFNMPKTVTTISDNAFSGCTNLSTVTFDNNAMLTTIASGAFADCGLKSITIPETVKSIGADVFRNCEVLKVVNLSAKIDYVSPQAFKHCWNLDNIFVDKDNIKYSSVDGYLLTADKETLVIFPPGKANDKFTLLPPSITEIGEYAFYDCSNLENVVIPNKVEKIGKRAFGLCSNLNTITFLCDKIIDPANIDQEGNTMSFDDGTNVAPDMFKHINTYVRSHLQEGFAALPFYQKFKVVGTSFEDNGNEYIPVSDNTVNLLSVGNRDYTFVVPTKAKGIVAIDKNLNEEKEYDVRLIGDYAFQNASEDVKEVVIKNNVEYIGGKAFKTKDNTSTIKNIFFIESNPTKRMLSTVRFELDETGNDYNEFASTTKIYVKKSACERYKDVWHKMVYKPNVGYQESQYNFVNQIDYRIPDVSIKTKYGTFAREFDTDFSDYFTTLGKSEVAAFVAGSPIKVGNGDYGTSTHKVTMTSIDENGGVEGNYGYIPAYTGVLLKVLDKVETDGDFYYTIGEKDDVSYDITNNIMNECTVNYKEVFASEDDPIYVMQGGVFRKATAPITKFPVHKAYMKPGTIGAGAKIMFVFDDEETVTSLDEIIASDVRKDSNDYYNLNGQRVENPQQGIYIKNGKKIVIK